MVREFSGASPAVVLHRPVFTDVTGSRTLGSTYQNTTGRPILVVVAIYCVRGNVVNAFAYGEANSDTGSPPTTVQCRAGLSTFSNVEERMWGNLVFMVRNQHYYEVDGYVDSVNSSVTLQRWIELQL